MVKNVAIFFVRAKNSERKSFQKLFSSFESRFQYTKQKPKTRLFLCFIKNVIGFQSWQIWKVYAQNKKNFFKLNGRQKGIFVFSQIPEKPRFKQKLLTQAANNHFHFQFCFHETPSFHIRQRYSLVKSGHESDYSSRNRASTPKLEINTYYQSFEQK